MSSWRLFVQRIQPGKPGEWIYKSNLGGLKMAQNEVLVMVEKMAGLSLVFIPVIVMVIEYAKQSLGYEGTKAQILASGISLGFGILLVVAFLVPGAAQWVGIAIFLVVMTVGPSGGFKMLESFLGKKL
jgi:hypothetical protein